MRPTWPPVTFIMNRFGVSSGSCARQSSIKSVRSRLRISSDMIVTENTITCSTFCHRRRRTAVIASFQALPAFIPTEPLVARNSREISESRSPVPATPTTSRVVSTRSRLYQ